MTEKEFLKLFNDIDDKFINEEQDDLAPLYPVEINYSAQTKSALRRFSRGGFAAAAAVCVVAVGGIFAAGHYFGSGEFLVGNTTTEPSQTVTENTSLTVVTAEGEKTPVIVEIPSEIPGELPRDQMPVLYETTLNCNGKSYTLTALLHRVRSDETMGGAAGLDQNYIWGDVALELSLDGEVKDTLWVYENCYGMGQVGGMPFDKENLGNDYFRVLNMEQDVLAYITPNKQIGAEDENKGAILNAMLFTVNTEGILVTIQRYATDEEMKELGTRPNGELTIDGSYFKLTPDFDVEPNSLTLHLNRTVENPWWENDSVFPAGDIPVSFDFEEYRIKCENEYYKYLVYHYTDDWYPPLTLIDGSVAPNREILAYDADYLSDCDRYSVNFCFAVPFFTSAENRVAGEKGAWTKLKKGYHHDLGYYVRNAVSDYFINENAGYYPYSYRCRVDLRGELNCTAAAEKLYDPAGGVSAVKITLDRECCGKLFGLEPSVKVLDDKYANSFNKDFDDDRICFILTEEMSNYYKVFDSLNDKDLVRVSLEANEFSISYGFGTDDAYDGMTLLGFDDDGYILEILG